MGTLARERNQKAKARSAGHKTASDIPELAPGMLVEGLVRALHSESLKLAFPYITMHCACINKPRKDRELFDPLLEEIHRQAVLAQRAGHMDDMPSVFPLIFLAHDEETRTLDYSPLKAEAEVLTREISEGGFCELAMRVLQYIGLATSLKENEGVDMGPTSRQTVAPVSLDDQVKPGTSQAHDGEEGK